MARSIFELIRSRTIAVRENARVLDFGCGTGRLTTWLHGRQSGWDLYGTDVDAEAIAWAQKNLTNVARFACNLVAPHFLTGTDSSMWSPRYRFSRNLKTTCSQPGLKNWCA
ncbi:MAG TPA: class I SAM-dependent methyltransferase [Rudaea sp.]|nr:class I SAM-dependent methyltransferase [Rudaea sp.]